MSQYILYNMRTGALKTTKTALPRPDGQMISFWKTTFGHVAGVLANGLDAFGVDEDIRGAGGGGRGHDGVAQRPWLRERGQMLYRAHV